MLDEKIRWSSGNQRKKNEVANDKTWTLPNAESRKFALKLSIWDRKRTFNEAACTSKFKSEFQSFRFNFFYGNRMLVFSNLNNSPFKDAIGFRL